MKILTVCGITASLLVSGAVTTPAAAAERPCKRTVRHLVVKDEGKAIIIKVVCPRGPKGDTGPAGPRGAQGQTGPAGPVRAPQILSTRSTVPPGTSTPILKGPVCPEGTKVISGGVSAANTNGFALVSGYPHLDDNRWVGSVRNTGPNTISVGAISVCLPVG